MATNGVDEFLRAEEEAHRLVDVLKQLKEETESYRSARVALGQAAESVSELATRLAEIAGDLGVVVEMLRSIGTPELLRRQEALASDVATLRQDLDSMQRLITEAHQQDAETIREELLRGQEAVTSGVATLRQDLDSMQRSFTEVHQRDTEAIREDVSAQLADARAAVRAVRYLVLGNVGLLVTVLVLLAWLVLSLVRG